APFSLHCTCSWTAEVQCTWPCHASILLILVLVVEEEGALQRCRCTGRQTGCFPHRCFAPAGDE
ncbi:hypothetical protein E2320_019186, partial [Naja naja]